MRPFGTDLRKPAFASLQPKGYVTKKQSHLRNNSGPLWTYHKELAYGMVKLDNMHEVCREVVREGRVKTSWKFMNTDYSFVV